MTGGKQDVKITVKQADTGGGLQNPISFEAGTGFSIGGGTSFDGTSPINLSFAIGQDVGTSSTVQFQNVSASSTLHIGDTSFEISQRDDGKAQVNTDWVVQGDIIAENYIISSSITHMTTSFSSGSTIFGDTMDDIHQFTGSVVVTGSISSDEMLLLGESQVDINNYIRKSFVKKSISISGATASFNAETASAPSTLTATNEDDFVFFINGQYMEHDALTIQQSSSTFLLKIDTESIGYELEADDEIIAQGKFDS